MVIVMDMHKLRRLLDLGRSLPADTPVSQLFNMEQRRRALGNNRRLIDDADYPVPSPRECSNKGLYKNTV